MVSDNTIEEIISGPLGVFAVYEELGPLYKGGGDDSVTTVTNASGGIVQELSYDAWGNLRNPTTWSGSFTGTPRFDRGFTGHEHRRHFGLINMTTCL